MLKELLTLMKRRRYISTIILYREPFSIQVLTYQSVLVHLHPRDLQLRRLGLHNALSRSPRQSPLSDSCRRRNLLRRRLQSSVQPSCCDNEILDARMEFHDRPLPDSGTHYRPVPNSLSARSPNLFSGKIVPRRGATKGASSRDHQRHVYTSARRVQRDVTGQL